MIKWWLCLLIGIGSLLLGVLVEKIRYFFIMQEILEMVDDLMELLKGKIDDPQGDE